MAVAAMNSNEGRTQWSGGRFGRRPLGVEPDRHPVPLHPGRISPLIAPTAFSVFHLSCTRQRWSITKPFMKMTLSRLALSGLLFTVPAFAAAIPRKIPSTAGGSPIWVAFDDAIDEEEHLRESETGPEATAFMSAVRQFGRGRTATVSGSDPCANGAWAQPELGHFRRDRTFPDLMSDSLDIASGTVTAISQGFLTGSPQSLLRVEVNHTYRSSGTLFQEQGAILVSYPYVTATIDGALVCVRPQGSSFKPAIGDRVAVFGYFAGLGARKNVLLASAARQLIFEHAGALILPSRMEGDDLRNARNLDAVLRMVSDAVAAERRVAHQNAGPPAQ
jgi:hypothetical protein